MTYKEFLNLVLLDLIENKKHGHFQGLCYIITKYKYLSDKCCIHRLRLRDQIDLDLGRWCIYLDKSFMFRLKHGNLLPYKLLTNNMRNNMRIAYIKSLIAKEE